MNIFILMGLLILLSAGLFILFSYLNEKSYDDYQPFAITAFFGGIIKIVIIIILFIDWLYVDIHAKDTINEYNSTKMMIENYHPGDYGNANVLMEKCIFLNSTIATHKARVDNKCIGCLYSKDVANLEPLVIKYNDVDE